MKFVSVRELRSKSAEVWQTLGKERELVITSNGKPIAIVSATDEEHFEQSLQELRRARVMQAVKSLQQTSVAEGRDEIAEEEIDGEIAAVRERRQP